MSEKSKKETSLEKKFKINIPYQEISKKMEGDFIELSKTLKIQGFRPGKVPISFVKERYFTDVLKKTSEKLIQQEGNKTIEKNGYKLAGQPKVTLLSDMKENIDLVAEFAFDTIPDFQIKDFKNVELDRFITKVENEDIDKVIKKLYNDYKQFSKPQKPRKSKKGDKLVISFKGFIDGEAFEGGTAENETIELGNNNYLPEFDKFLVEKNSGEKFTIDLKFPDNYHNSKFKGKEAKFDIEVKEILEPILIKNEEELAKKTGAKSINELREKISNELEKYSNELSFNIIKNSIIKILEKDYKFPLPNSLVERELQIEKNNINFDKNISKDQQEKVLNNLKKIAEKKVKIGLIISEIGIQNNINVTSKELETEIAKICMQYPGREKEIIEHYKNNPAHMNALKGPIFENKVVQFFVDNATVKDVKVTSNELTEKISKIEKELQKENKG